MLYEGTRIGCFHVCKSVSGARVSAGVWSAGCTPGMVSPIGLVLFSLPSTVGERGRNSNPASLHSSCCVCRCATRSKVLPELPPEQMENWMRVDCCGGRTAFRHVGVHHTDALPRVRLDLAAVTAAVACVDHTRSESVTFSAAAIFWSISRRGVRRPRSTAHTNDFACRPL